MYIELEKNALDSLIYGLDYYEKFFELEDKYSYENPTYLKMALIMIHNACELFIKKVLSNINELLIYKDISHDKFLQIYSYKIHEAKNMNLDYYMTGDEYSIHTVDYTTLVKRFKYICNLTDKQFANLEWLGKYRNKVNHFGIDMTIDYYRILIVLNNALDIITTIIYRNLNKDRQGKKILDSIYERILDIEEIGKEEEKIAWTTFFSDNFIDLNLYLNQLTEDDDLQTFLRQNNFKLELIQGDHIDSEWFILNFHNNDDEKSEYIRIAHDPFYDVSLFVGESIDGPIYYVLNHSEYLIKGENTKCFYVYNKPLLIPNIEEQVSEFWEVNRKERLCYSTEFNYEQLVRAIKKTLKSKL